MNVLSEVNIGKRILFKRSKSSTLLFEGKVEEFSPLKDYVKISGRWIENKKGIILAVLSSEKTKRNTVYES